MQLQAFAKINWSLDITGVREDGYHLMDMVMQPVSLADEITLTPSPVLSISTDGYPHSRADETNLAFRAALLLKEYAGISDGVHLHLHKRIPMGAGLGGGSADAAAVLRGLNVLWRLNIPANQLEKMSLSLGADVPFCLRGGVVRTRGIGEILEDHPFSSSFWLLVFQPCRALSTRDIFEAWHESGSVRGPDTPAVLSALASGNLSLLSASIANVLEPVSAARCPEIPEAVALLKDCGAVAAQMTGSGSAVFGVFRSRPAAEKARTILLPRFRRIHLCHTQSDSIRIMEE